MNRTNITIGQYIPRQSFLHSLDPRTKISASIILLLALLLAKSTVVILIFFFLVCSLFWCAKLNPLLALRGIKPFIFLLILTVMLNAFSGSGKELIKLPVIGLALTYEGLIRGFSYAVRLLNMILLASLLTYTTQPMSLSDAIERMLRPFKRVGVPAHEVGMMISISLRFIPILLEESERIRRAQMSRGADWSGSIKSRIRNILPLLIPLFISTFRRANDLALAMDSRCYRGGEGRSSYIKLSFSTKDGLALAGAGILALPLILAW